jgi:nucleoside-diphosphate-sugar epimerase
MQNGCGVRRSVWIKINNVKSQQRTLIIGGSGYIGRELTMQLAEAGYPVVVAGRKPFQAAYFPKETGWLQLDASAVLESQWRQLLQGFHTVIFAAGADDRSLPPAPAFDFFVDKNLRPVRHLMAAAAAAGVKRVAILGSYFSYFERNNPGGRLAETHPYIRSRKLQWQAAMSYASEDLSVVVLEIPYVVGPAPHTLPLWAPLVRYVNWGPPFLFYTRGGTALVSLPVLSKHIIRRLEEGVSGCYPVAEGNMNWKTFLSLLQKNPDRRLRVITVPSWLLKAVCVVLTFYWKMKNSESGLHAPAFVEMQTKELFLPVEDANDGSNLRTHLFGMVQQCIVHAAKFSRNSGQVVHSCMLE